MEADRSAATTTTDGSAARGPACACATTATTGHKERPEPTASTTACTPGDTRLTCSAGSSDWNRLLICCGHQAITTIAADTPDAPITAAARSTIWRAVLSARAASCLSTAAVDAVARLATTSARAVGARTAASVASICRSTNSTGISHAICIGRDAAIAAPPSIDCAALNRQLIDVCG
jgi:hypothetical protein